MKLGIMQPYFFPYLGYFDIINHVDQWVVFDTTQYIRHGWVNRNRVQHPTDGWQYIGVPIRKAPLETSISEIAIADDTDWRQKLLAQLAHYWSRKKRAPFYRQTMSVIERSLAATTQSLAELNVVCLANSCEYLGIHFDPQVFSKLDVKLGPVETPGEWALRICQAMGAAEYVNPPGGVNIYDAKKFDAAGIKLTIKPLVDFQYPCAPATFIPHLSIIDVMMWNRPEALKHYLDKIR